VPCVLYFYGLLRVRMCTTCPDAALLDLAPFQKAASCRLALFLQQQFKSIYGALFLFATRKCLVIYSGCE